MVGYGGYSSDDDDDEQELRGSSTPTITQSDDESVVVDSEEQESPPDLQLLNFGVNPRLHASFVDAINQLGGLHNASPKKIQKAMGVEFQGLTLHHLKSHLQQYKLGKEGQETFSQNLEGRSTSSASTTSLCSPPSQKKHARELTKELQEQKKDEEQFTLQNEIEKRLKFRQDAERRYMDIALQNACKRLADQIMGHVGADIAGAFEKEVAGFGTMLPRTPQMDLCPAYHVTEEDTGMQLSLEDQLGRSESQ